MANKDSLQWNTKIQAIFIALLCSGDTTFSQQLNFDNYTQNNGLVNNEVHDIMQASNGLMYFGTPAGLSILDGTSFTNYDAGRGFRHNIISGIQELSNEKIVFFANSNQFYFVRDQHLIIDSFPGQSSVKNICRGKSGTWYACTYSGLFIFKDGKLFRTRVTEGKSYPGINCVVEWQDSLLIVGRSYESVDIYNIHTWQRVASSAEKLFVRNIYIDKHGNAWIASIGSGVLYLDRAGLRGDQVQFEKLPSPFDPFKQNEFRTILEDKQGALWMGSINHGLIKYDPATGQFMHISMEQGLASNTIFSLCCDNEGNLWIGTNRGVQKLSPLYTLSYSSKEGLPADLVLDALSLGGNRAITCGYSGVGYIEGLGKKTTAWYPPLQDEYFFNFIHLQDKYFGLSLKKLVTIQMARGKIYAGKSFSLAGHYRCMIPFQGDKLLLGGDDSIMIFSNGKLSTLSKDKVRFTSCMTVDDSGMLWTGSLSNMINGFRLQKKENGLAAELVTHYPSPINEKQDYIQCITSYNKKNRILYGSSQHGVIILSFMNNQLIRSGTINVSSGLSNNNVVSFCWHNDSTLLVGNGYGMDKIVFTGPRDSFYVHNINDYYNFSNTVYSITKSENGALLLGTESGLLQIPSVDIEGNPDKNLPIAISKIQLLMTPDSIIDLKKTIELPYNYSGLTISYTSPSFLNERNTRFTWNLYGGNQDNWSKPSASSHVSFLSLSPGMYRFMVKPVNLFGRISLATASVLIVIRPPFWQRWWFYLIGFMVIGGAVWFFVKKRISNIRHEAALKNKIVETEMMALRAQMNPHFIFNCMNIIDGFITSDRKQEAQDFLQKFSSLIRLVLENSQHQQVLIQQDLQALTLYTELEAIRNNHLFDYEFNVDDELVDNGYRIPPLLLQPYIENAIVHGLRNRENGGGRLLVKIQKENENIRVVIEDNGIGRKKAMLLNEENKRPHQSLGMKFTSKRIDLLRAINQNKLSIDIVDAQPKTGSGTRVTIILPLNLKFE